MYRLYPFKGAYSQSLNYTRALISFFELFLPESKILLDNSAILVYILIREVASNIEEATELPTDVSYLSMENLTALEEAGLIEMRTRKGTFHIRIKEVSPSPCYLYKMFPCIDENTNKKKKSERRHHAVFGIAKRIFKVFIKKNPSSKQLVSAGMVVKKMIESGYTEKDIGNICRWLKKKKGYVNIGDIYYYAADAIEGGA